MSMSQLVLRNSPIAIGQESLTWVVKFFSNNQLEGVPQLPPELPDQALFPPDEMLRDNAPELPPALQPLETAEAALAPFPPRPGGGLREPFDMGLLPQSSEVPPDGVVGLFSLFG